MVTSTSWMMTGALTRAAGRGAAWAGATAAVTIVPASATARPARRIRFSTIYSAFVSSKRGLGADEVIVSGIERQGTDERRWRRAGRAGGEPVTNEVPGAQARR